MSNGNVLTVSKNFTAIAVCLASTVALSACTERNPSEIVECIATTPSDIGANHLRDYSLPAVGREGLLAKVIMEFGVSRESYYRNFKDSKATADAIEAQLNTSALEQNKKHSRLGESDVVMFCFGIEDKNNPESGGYLRPYITPTAGRFGTTAVFTADRMPSWYRKVQTANPDAKLFTVSVDQTKLLPKS